MTLLIFMFCILFSGLLSAAEIAFVTARRNQIRSLAESGDARAQHLRLLRENPERTLAVIQLGESLVNAIGAAVGFIGTARYLSPWLTEHFAFSPVMAQFFSVGAVVLCFTYLDVIFGELVPKILALRHPLWVALKTSQFLKTLEAALRPCVWFLEWSTRVFVQMFFRSKLWKASDEDKGEFDLEVLPDPHRHLVLNAVALEKRRVQEIYLPWENVVWLDWAQSFEEIAQTVSNSVHSRFPVLREGKLQGIITNRDFLKAVISGERDWHSMLRKVTRLQITTSLFRALRTLQGRTNQLAVAYDGEKIVGIITTRDIFEAIVGDIYDEDAAGALTQILGEREGFPLPTKMKRSAH